MLPLTGEVGWGGINVEGYTPPPGQELQVDIRVRQHGLLFHHGDPAGWGRFFAEHDTRDAPAGGDHRRELRAALLAAWTIAVGKHLWFDPKKPMTIAGRGGNGEAVRPRQRRQNRGLLPAAPAAPTTRRTWWRAPLADPAALAGAIVREIHAVDPAVVVYDVRTMQERLYDSLARRRFSALMLGAFAAFALLLAAVGVFGVMSWLVSQTVHDMGLRLALGARPGDIVSLVVRQGMALAGSASPAG